MILKGKVSSIEGSKVRVVFPDKMNSVSAPLDVAEHVGSLQTGDDVAVIFFSNSLKDGLVIAKF